MDINKNYNGIKKMSICFNGDYISGSDILKKYTPIEKLAFCYIPCLDTVDCIFNENGQIIQINQSENDKHEIEYDGDDIQYYIDWPLYLYYYAKGNVEKADKYLTSAYYHITKDKRDKYLSDNERTKNLHKYYYIHEIIETYNQNIR